MELRRFVTLAVLAGSFVTAAPALAAPPPNDNFASAEAITGTTASLSGTTVQATLEAGEPNHFAGNGSVWYSWTPPQNMVVQLTSCYPFPGSSPFKTQLWSGSALISLIEIERRADERELSRGLPRRRVLVQRHRGDDLCDLRHRVLGRHRVHAPSGCNPGPRERQLRQRTGPRPGARRRRRRHQRRSHGRAGRGPQRGRGRRLGLVSLDRAEAHADLDRQL